MSGHASKLGNSPSFKEDVFHAQKTKMSIESEEVSRPREFFMQKTDFELNSIISETASNDGQPSMYKRSEFGFTPA